MNRFLLLFGLVCGVMSHGDSPRAQSSDGAVAFVGVNVIPMDIERVLHGQTVIVRGGRIVAMGSAAEVDVPEGAERIDGEGRYLVPGLADMHVHIFSEDELPLYLANGVTTVRNMWGWDMHLEMREGHRPGPAVYSAGAIIDGDPPALRGSAVVATAADADSVVAEQARAGYDFVKVYDNLTAPAYAAVVLAAEKYGLDVVGHTPSAVGLHGVLSAGQRSIEHLDGYAAAAAYDTAVSWSSQLKATELAEVARATRRAGTWVTPTLNVLERGDMSAGESEVFLSRPELEYLPPFYKRFCCGKPFDPDNDLPDDKRTLRRANRFRAVEALRSAGVPLLLGTDTGNRFVLPGYDIHNELRLLVAAGLTPFEALRAGTRDAAFFLGDLYEFGTIEVGKRADMILVRDNPLADVSAMEKPAGVMARGTWLPSARLDEMLRELADKHAKDE